MSVNKIITKVDGVPSKTINFNDLKTGLSKGSHTITVEAWNGNSLVSIQTKNITVQESASFDPKTTAYMNAVGTPNDSSASIYRNKTNADIWNLCEQVVQHINTNDAWSGTKSIHLMQGDTATKNSYNLKDINTFSMTFYGGWIHDAQGNKGNGTNTYGLFGLEPSTMSIDNCAFIVSSLSETDTGFQLGAIAPSISRIALSSKRGGKYYMYLGDTIYDSTGTTAIGILSLSGLNGRSIVKVNSNLISDDPRGGDMPIVELAYGAWNASDGPYLNTDNYMGSTACCTQTVEPVINQAIQMWETGLGRLTI